MMKVPRSPELDKAVEIYATLIFLDAIRYRMESHSVLKQALYRATEKDIWETFRPFEGVDIKSKFKTSRKAISHVWRAIDYRYDSFMKSGKRRWEE